jgi:DNA repair exonuclease SbcCD nuclease subunit
MKIALITDTHAGARGESPVFNDYFFQFWEQTFFPYLEYHNIKKVIHLGDAVERQKYITYVIANSWRSRFWDRLRANRISVDVLVGNHDAPNHRYSNTPNAIQELYGDYPNMRVFSECCVQMYDGTPIALIPWINKTNFDSTMEFIQKVPATVAMGHLELNGFLMDQHNVSKFGLDRELFKKFQMVMTGHYHHKSTDGHIFYLGNTYEITWLDYNDPRGFHIFDTTTRELEFIQNPFKMFHKIEYKDDDYFIPPNLDGRIVRVTVLQKTDQSKFDVFLKSLQANTPHKIEIDDQTESTSSTAEITNVADTMTVIDQYIDEVDTTLDHDRLKSIMRDLYKQAHDSV